jgi:hypothetical protein
VLSSQATDKFGLEAASVQDQPKKEKAQKVKKKKEKEKQTIILKAAAIDECSADHVRPDAANLSNLPAPIDQGAAHELSPSTLAHFRATNFSNEDVIRLMDEVVALRLENVALKQQLEEAHCIIASQSTASFLDL